jgi:hypothetical protein
MSNLSTLPKGDSAWLLRKAIERIIQQISVLETNIGSSTTGNSANTQVIFNDAGTLRGDAGLTYNKTTDLLTVGTATITGDLTVDTSTLKVSSSTDTVCVGATTTDAKFRVIDASYNGLRIGFLPGTANYNLYDATVHEFRTANVTPQQLYALQASSSVWYDGAGGTRMTLNSTGLGVGVTPSAGRMHIKGGASQSPLVLDTLGYNQIVLQLNGANRGQIYADATNCLALVDSTGSNLRLVVTDSGNVGVGVTPSGSYKVEVSGKIGSTNAIEITGNNSVSAATGNGQAAHGSSTTLGNVLLGQGSSYDITFLNKSGSVAGYVATGATTITTSSDERIKENLVPITNAISKVSSLRGVIGNFVKDFDPTLARQPFLIAQDVDKVLPEAVVKANPDQWGVNYTQVIPLLVAAIQELTTRVEALEA